MKTKIVLSSIFAVALGVGNYIAIGSSSQVSSNSGLSLAANAQTAEEIDTSGIIEMTMGKKDAPISVIEYGSFTCPHCANFNKTVMPDLKKNYVDTGKVKFTHREVYFDRYGLWAGMVARCGGEMRYFAIADEIYKTQKEWIGDGQPTTIDANLRKLGLKAGLSTEQVDACLKDSDKAQALVALFQKNSAADEIDSTPSFIINGEKYSNMSYDAFSELLDAKLAE